MPELFNYLGIYLTQAGSYDAAYEAFDSVLELDPTCNYEHLNCGIPLYDNGRYRLAQDDLQAFYHYDPNDPFHSPWLFLVEKKLTMVKRVTRCKAVNMRANKGQWEWNIVEFYLEILANQR